MINLIFDEEFLSSSCLSLLEYYPYPAWIRDKQGKYLWVNDGFLRFFKVDRKKVIGKFNKDFLNEEISFHSYQSEQEVFKKRIPLTFLFDEKTYRTTVFKKPIFRNDEIVAIAALMVDLTQELELESKLNNTKDFYASLLANMGEALFFVNVKQEFEVINRKGREFLTALGFEGPSTYQSWYDFFSQNYVKEKGKEYTKENSIILKALQGEEILNEEITMIVKSGKRMVFRVSAIPSKNKAAHSIEGVILTVTDITTERNLLKKLEKKNRLIQERNEELHHFAYSAAHDLRDPLRNINLSALLIQENLAEKNYEEANNLLQRLLNTTSYGNSLVKNLLDYSAANQEIQMEKICLTEIVQHNQTILNTLLEEAEAKIIYKDLPCVWGNRQQLQIVFQNLISNAIRYRITEPLEIWISADRKAGGWEISVKDNGPGIDAAYKDVIFQPFKRVGAHPSGRSSGLGLSICRRIIEQHGGEIWLEEQFTQGACFKFTLQGLDEESS